MQLSYLNPLKTPKNPLAPLSGTNELGHELVCGGRYRWTVRRLDAVKRALGAALASVDSTEVTMELGT